jgi:hypothetical protein
MRSRSMSASISTLTSSVETVLQVGFDTLGDGSAFNCPLIRDETTIEYICDGKEGMVSFDGYFHVEDHAPPYPEDDALPMWELPTRNSRWLPIKLRLYMQRREKEPYGYEKETSPFPSFIPWDVTYPLYRVLEEHEYIVEVYKRIIHESTYRISTIEDEDGTPMRVCFNSTHRQTVYFRVLEDITKSPVAA